MKKGMKSRERLALSDSEDEGMCVMDGDVKVPLTKFLSLRHEAKKNATVPPRSYVVDSISITGQTNSAKRRVELQVVFDLRTFGKEDEWLEVPLLPLSCVINKSEVIPGDKGSKTVAFVDPNGDALCLKSLGGNLRYTVKVDIHLQFSGQQLESFKLSNLPKSTRNKLDFTIEKSNLDVKVEPMVGSAEYEEAADPHNPEKKVTKVSCSYPPSHSIGVQWREKIVETKVEVEEPAKKKTIVTASQNILHSIGEGVVRSRAVYDFTVTHGARTMLEIDVHSTERKEVRILSVNGRAIKRWQVADVQGSTSNSTPSPAQPVDGVPAGDDTLPPYAGTGADVVVDVSDIEMKQVTMGKSIVAKKQRLTVWFEYGIEGDYQLVITSELEMVSNSAPVGLPSFSARAVDRETGHAAVEARTNVEINEINRQGVAKVDVGEVPKQCSSAAQNPILHAYKFLETPYAIILDVTKHDDAMSLVSIIEEAWVQATQSEDGNILHRVVLRVRNSQKQFVRIMIPEREHDIWSSVVGGQPVKAAIDHKTGEVMIPLEKSSGKVGQKPKPFLVELVYMTKSMEMKEDRGTLKLAFAKFDIPVQQLYGVVYLPNLFDYGEFSGDLQETRRNIKAVPSTDGGEESTGAPLHRLPLQQARCDSSSNLCIDSDSGSDEDFMNEFEERYNQKTLSNIASTSLRKKGKTRGLLRGSMMEKGHVPVKISKLEVGNRYNFEKLLVQSTHLNIQVDFKKQPRKDQRTLDGGRSCLIM